MKVTDTTARLGILAIGMGILFLAFRIGQSQGRSAGEAQSRAAAMTRTSTRRDGSLNPDARSATSAKSSISGRDAAARIKALWAASADPRLDFELLEKMDGLLDQMSSQQIAEFLGTLPQSSFALRFNIMCYWTQRDGPAALGSLGGGSFDRMIRANAFGGWIAEDPDAALAWARENMDPLERKVLLHAIPKDIKDTVGEWSNRAPDLALKWLEALPNGPNREALSDGGMRELMGRDRYADAAKIANLMETPQLRRESFRKISSFWSLTNPGEAAEWKSNLSAEDRALLAGE